MVSHRPGVAFPQATAVKSDAATRAQIVDAVEPLYRVLFPKRDVLRFTVTPGRILPHKASETQGWIVECYDNAGREIAHGLWDEQGHHHVTVSKTHYNAASSTQPALSAKAAVQVAEDWLCQTGMAVPQSANGCASMAARSGDIWHVDVRLSDGVVMVWMNARTGEVHQATRTARNASCGY